MLWVRPCMLWVRRPSMLWVRPSMLLKAFSVGLAGSLIPGSQWGASAAGGRATAPGLPPARCSRWARGLSQDFRRVAGKVQTRLKLTPEQTESLALSQHLRCFLEKYQVSGITQSCCEQEENVPRGRTFVPFTSGASYSPALTSMEHAPEGGGAFVRDTLTLHPTSGPQSPGPALRELTLQQATYTSSDRGSPHVVCGGPRPKKVQRLPRCPLSAGLEELALRLI